MVLGWSAAMSVFFFFLGLLQCVIIWFLGKMGLNLNLRGRRERERADHGPGQAWPACAVIIPVSGLHAATEAALASLLTQDYPDYTLYLVTADDADPACGLIARLLAQDARVRHVVSGLATENGQKNHSQLAGVASAGDSADIYVFCDSTHVARPDFLRCLTLPIVAGEAEFTTGYHEVEPGDQGIITLAYAVSVLFMRFAQAIPAFTQPWGGAMAMSWTAYERYSVGGLWQSTVVDDCSLGALLARRKAHIRLCAGALLRTWASRHAFPVWRAWMERQILVLKFCMPGQWLGLGCFCLLMLAPPVWFLATCLCGLLGFGPDTGPFLALCWLCCLWLAIGGWRVFVAKTPDTGRWIAGFFLAVFMFAIVYLRTAFKQALVWRNITYKVGAGGVVKGITRL